MVEHIVVKNIAARTQQITAVALKHGTTRGYRDAGGR